MKRKRFGITLLLICAAVLGSVSSSNATDSVLKPLHNGDQYFGSPVALDGDTALVGATGIYFAYIFGRNQGGTDAWGVVRNRYFVENAVAVSGDIAIIRVNPGASGNDGVYVYYRNQGGANNWGLVKTIWAPSVSNNFVGAVAINGDTLVIGSPNAEIAGRTYCGAAYIYQRNQGGTDNWGLVKQIIASDGASEDRFGSTVSISGDIVAVGASGVDIGGNTDQGAAYVFYRNRGGANNWGQVKKIVASDGAAGDSFRRVSNYGDKLVVGAIFADVNGKADQGAAYVFYRDRGGPDNWGQVKKISVADGAAQDYFGTVSIYGDTIVVGASGADVGGKVDQGAAYIFYRTQGGTDNWGQVKKITASDGASGDRFGQVQVSGNTLLVGAPYADVGSTNNQGAAYIFYRDRGGANNWGQVKKLVLPDVTPPENPSGFTSSSHTVDVWSNDNTVDVMWWGWDDYETDVEGWSILWDNAPASVPDTIKDIDYYPLYANYTTSPALGNGDWYFHIRSVDGAGNWANGAAHFGPFKIDTTPPTAPSSLTSSDHTVNVWSTDNTLTVNWSGATDAASGVAGYSVWFDQNPTTLPPAVVNTTAGPLTSSPLADGSNWYAHVRTVDAAGSGSTTAIHLGPFKIDTTPPTSSAFAPEFTVSPFAVQWTGADAGSGLANYDLWVRDELTGTWISWLAGTTATSVTFTDIITGHTYYFGSQARDVAGNLEVDLPADGDTHTTVAAYQVTGQVSNNRAQPVFNATVSVDPAALNTAATRGDGSHALFFDSSGVYTLTASRAGFGTLPPRYDLNVDSHLSGVDFVLPPLDEAVINGGWESGDLNDWWVNTGLTQTVEISVAHTGRYGLRLESSGSGGLDFEPSITQSVVISAEWTRPTLSWLSQANPGDAFLVAVSTETTTIPITVLLTAGAWRHDWFDLSAFRGQTVTLQFGFQTQAAGQQILLDEISVGDSAVGVYPVYLPLVRRSP